MPRQLNFRTFYRALSGYDAAEGTFDASEPKAPATRAWRWVERVSIIAAMDAGAALTHAGMMDSDGKLTPKGVELLVIRPGLTLEEIATIPPR